MRRLRVPAAAVAGGAGATALYLRGADDEYRMIPETALPETYEPQQIAEVWSQHPRCVLARLVTVARKTTPFAARLLGDWTVSHRGNETPDEVTTRHGVRARELRMLLTELGPTFIKAGQAVSIRPDVVPPGAIYELQKLCDAVPSYPTSEALRLIEAELGQPPSQPPLRRRARRRRRRR